VNTLIGRTGDQRDDLVTGCFSRYNVANNTTLAEDYDAIHKVKDLA
jgi:hypothetical protein